MTLLRAPQNGLRIAVLGTAFRAERALGPRMLVAGTRFSTAERPGRWATVPANRRCKITLRQFSSAQGGQGNVTPFLLADIGEGIKECEIVQWFVKPGDQIQQFDKICEVQSDKASVEITSRYDGIVSAVHYKVGELAQVGRPLIDIATSGAVEAPAAAPAAAAPAAAPVATAPAPTPETCATKGTAVLATPAVRRLAREHKLNLASVQGSGKGGRVLKDDIFKHIESQDGVAASPATVESQPMPLSAVQKAMFRTMSRALAIPHFGYSDEFVMNAAAQLRAVLNADLERGTGPVDRITPMPLIIKSFSQALRHFPVLNARLLNTESGDPKAAQLVMQSHHNIGVAMDTKMGLLVPNIKHVERLSLLEIAAELERLKQLGKANALGPADLQGGTITLSNIGIIGGTNLKPVIVPGELCIAAIGKVQSLPRFEKGAVVAHDVMQVSFSADHRIVDGATIARFSQKWKQLLENPALLVAELK